MECAVITNLVCLDSMDLSTTELAVAAAAVAAGGTIQGSIGFGRSLVSVPVIAFIEPRALPATLLILAIPFTAAMALRERAHIDVRGVWLIAIGRLPGTALAVWLLSIVSGQQISIVIGASVIVAVVLSAVAPELELGTRTRVLAGAVSGLMGTAAAIGGPPLALVCQHRPGTELRSTHALSFVVGSAISLGALWASGHVFLDHLVLAGALLPGLAAGLWVAARLHAFLDKGWLRPAVLTFAAISGAVAIVRSV